MVEWVERNEELDMVYKNGLSNYNNWDMNCEKWEPNTAEDLPFESEVGLAFLALGLLG